MDESTSFLIQVSGFTKAVYKGFVLKKGYYYGLDSDGTPIATSGYTKNNKLCLYRLAKGTWEKEWIDKNYALKLYPELSSALR